MPFHREIAAVVLVPFEGIDFEFHERTGHAVKEAAVFGDLFQEKRVGMVDDTEVNGLVGENSLETVN